MKIYTSYFGNLRRLHQEGIVPISIARWNPKWFEGISYKVVSPLPEMLRNDITEDQYKEQYKRKVLSRVDQSSFLKDLETLTRGRDCALLCYEKPGDFCHRRLLAEWMLETTGLEIPEFGYEKIEDKNPQVVQLTLF